MSGTMQVDTALRLIDNIVYRPGWKISATDHTDRFEGSIIVRIEYPAQNTNRDQAPEYPEPIMTRFECPLVISDCDDIDLYRCIIEKILLIEAHECREYFRVGNTNWAPFHPHRVDGMRRWGKPEDDLHFGLA